ncbi:MAG: hypothetical protein LQ352_003113 [Teloschistes flavicans]|nr:MAG: hypothetical protein LQ352_003113 [Teloschistes flavicans]
MARQKIDSSAGKTVLLFGPQALAFDEASFHRLRSVISSDANHRWVLQVVEELPRHWDNLRRVFPELSTVPGARLLEDLGDWFRNGSMKRQATDSHIPNVLLSPLVVIAQLTQYSQYLNSGSRSQQDVFASARTNAETLGFCTGILSAVVVSCSKDETQFAQLGATAVRLAMLVGALVDAQDAGDSDGESRSLATVWRSQQSSSEVTRILEHFPQVNILSLLLERLLELTTCLGIRFRLI